MVRETTVIFISCTAMDVEQPAAALYSQQSTHSSDRWVLWGRSIPKGEIVFLSQYLVIFIIVLSSIINISLGNSSDTFLVLLSLSLGAILPNPKLKSASKIVAPRPVT